MFSKHILLECCTLKNIRENYFTWSSLKELFENVDAPTITWTCIQYIVSFAFSTAFYEHLSASKLLADIACL